ncbi:18436_t:CDS:2, partial [Gigaspora rosea]
MLPDMGMVPISNQDIKKQRNEKISIQFSEYELWELLPNIWGSRKINCFQSTM